MHMSKSGQGDLQHLDFQLRWDMNGSGSKESHQEESLMKGVMRHMQGIRHPTVVLVQ